MYVGSTTRIMQPAPRELRRPLAHRIGALERRADYAPVAVKGTSGERGLHQKGAAVVRLRQHKPLGNGKEASRCADSVRRIKQTNRLRCPNLTTGGPRPSHAAFISIGDGGDSSQHTLGRVWFESSDVLVRADQRSAPSPADFRPAEVCKQTGRPPAEAGHL
jgi:hypothetical protein